MVFYKSRSINFEIDRSENIELLNAMAAHLGILGVACGSHLKSESINLNVGILTHLIHWTLMKAWQHWQSHLWPYPKTHWSYHWCDACMTSKFERFWCSQSNSRQWKSNVESRSKYLYCRCQLFVYGIKIFILKTLFWL